MNQVNPVMEDADHSAQVQGLHYQTFMANLHAQLRPQTYFEIGTLNGESLRLASCPSIAVDPQFLISSDVIGSKPSCLFFQQPSDQFFREHSPSQLFGREIDLAFLDGMHLFEFLLRDFINTEKHCRRNSVILLHDCLPPSFYITCRNLGDPVREQSRFPGWWTGDVWKVVPVLQKYRPSLSIHVTDCSPTGLVLVTNLDPRDTTLEDNYAEIVREFSKPAIDRAEYDDYWSKVKITPHSELMQFEHLATKFWL